jgi:hypothetical protein
VSSLSVIHFTRKLVLPSVLVVLSGTAAMGQPLQISQPGDGAMTCAQLAAEVGRMDQIASDAQTAKNDAESSGRMAEVAGGVATNAALYSGALGSVPGLGLFGRAIEGTVKSNAESTAQQQEQRVQNAQMRRVSLMGIYQGKGCMNAPAPAATTPTANAASGVQDAAAQAPAAAE